jgi:hypothetical protein
LHLDEEEDCKILCIQKIDDYAFLHLTKEKLMKDGLRHGLAIKLAKTL